jgi:hypothetical protein
MNARAVSTVHPSSVTERAISKYAESLMFSVAWSVETLALCGRAMSVMVDPVAYRVASSWGPRRAVDL